MMNPLVIATHNEGKVREFKELLADRRITVVSAGVLNLPEPEETGTTFAGNARIKSESAAQRSGYWALADDSGLCIEGLDGAPGVYSARWAGPTKDFNVAVTRIERELEAKGISPKGAAAWFTCVLSLTSPEGETVQFEGRVDGMLTFPPRGTKGFGYDPIFIPAGHHATFAEMEAEAKHGISHRAQALEGFTVWLADALHKREAS